MEKITQRHTVDPGIVVATYSFVVKLEPWRQDTLVWIRKYPEYQYPHTLNMGDSWQLGLSTGKQTVQARGTQSVDRCTFTFWLLCWMYPFMQNGPKASATWVAAGPDLIH